MKPSCNRVFSSILWLAGAWNLSAQTTLKGHWSGSIETPQLSLGVEIDLDNAASGWIGSISIPQQGASGIPLAGITFSGGKCSFRIKGAPGDPTFSGTLAADGKTVSGDFSQGGSSMAFKITRTGDAKVEIPKASPAVAAEFVGTWEGTLQAPAQSLRTIVRITNESDGAHAVLISVDQGNAEIPVTSIEQKGKHLSLQVNMAGGGYEADLNAAGTELTGIWTQSGGSLPLSLKKSAAAK